MPNSRAASIDVRSALGYWETMNEQEVCEDRLWKKNGWTARVIKNDGDDGWAVEMTRFGDAEPALVTHWTMGRDKKNPKPLNPNDFTTLVKTASEVLMRHEQHARAQLHKQLRYRGDDGIGMRADLDLIPDDDDPHAILTVYNDASGELLHTSRVAAGYKLNAANLTALK